MSYWDYSVQVIMVYVGLSGQVVVILGSRSSGYR